MIKRKTVVWIGGLTALAASVAVAGICLLAEVDRRWDEWSRRTDALQERLQNADARRPVLYGVATPGDAWNAYTAAVALATADKNKSAPGRGRS